MKIFNKLKKHLAQIVKICNSPTLKINNDTLIPIRTLNIHKANTSKALKDYLNNNTCSNKLFIDLQGIITKDISKPLESFFFLPKSFNNNVISGLMCLSNQERILLIENTPLGEEFRTILKTVFAKIIHNFFSKTHNSFNDLLLTAFKDLYHIKPIQMSIELSKILDQKKLITLTQHFINFIWYSKNIDYENFKDFCLPGIDTYSFKNSTIKMQSCIEAYFIKQNFLENVNNLIERPFIQFYMVNNEQLGELPGYIIRNSLQATGQKHSDFLIVNYFKNPPIINYHDVKTYTSGGLGKNQISVFTISDKTLSLETNNLIVSFNGFLRKNGFETNKEHPLCKVYEELLEIKHTKSLSKKEKYLQMNKKLLDLKYNTKFQEYFFSLSAGLNVDSGAFFYYFKNSLENRLNDFKEIKFEPVFPKNNQIVKEEQEKFLITFIEKVFPEEELKEIMFKNLEQYLSINQITNE